MLRYWLDMINKRHVGKKGQSNETVQQFGCVVVGRYLFFVVLKENQKDHSFFRGALRNDTPFGAFCLGMAVGLLFQEIPQKTGWFSGIRAKSGRPKVEVFLVLLCFCLINLPGNQTYEKAALGTNKQTSEP